MQAATAQQSSTHKSQQLALTLRRFDPTSETGDIPTSARTKITSDKWSSSSGFISSEKEHTISAQTSRTRIIDSSHQLPLGENKSYEDTSQINETVEASQPIMVTKFATRRSQSAAKTLDNQCQLYEEHLCNECNDCSVRHDALPYLWRVHAGGKWVAFYDSASIEQAFCNPDNNTYPGARYQVYIIHVP